MWTILGKLQAEVGLKKAGPHLLRHTALTRLANLGASVDVIQAVAHRVSPVAEGPRRPSTVAASEARAALVELRLAGLRDVVAPELQLRQRQ